MFFSAHVVDTGIVAALTRKTPAPADAPGLRAGRTMICGPFSPGATPRPQLKREAMVACWENEESLDRFLVGHKTGQALADGWHVRMELFRAVGVWPGLDDDMSKVARMATAPVEGPTVAITIGTAYLRTLIPFLKVNGALEEQFLADDGAIWGTGMTNLQKRVVGTLTVWRSGDAATEYMRNGAHNRAVKQHYDPAKDPTGHTFVTGGGFFGFRPISIHGTLGGKNPIPEITLVN